MCFGKVEARILVDAIEKELNAMVGIDLSKITHTPT